MGVTPPPEAGTWQEGVKLLVILTTVLIGPGVAVELWPLITGTGVAAAEKIAGDCGPLLEWNPKLNAWISRAGLVYEKHVGPAGVQRVEHVLDHGLPNPNRLNWTQFNVQGRALLELIDKAWNMRNSPGVVHLAQGAREVFEVPMGTTIGTRAETVIHMVVEGSRIITAYPK